MPAFQMLTFYITMSTIIVHVDFLLILMVFPRFCPHYLCYVDKSWTNCHLWTNLSFFLFLTIPYFIRVCELFTTTLFIFLSTSTRTIFSSIYSIYYIIITIVISLFTRLITVFIYGIIGTISIIFFCDLQTNYKHCLHLLNHII